MTDYRDLNKTNVADYTKYLGFFPKDASLNVYEIGDGEEDGEGFVNFLYRVWDTSGKSVIVKQAKNYYKVFDPGTGPFVVSRNAHEAEVMKIKRAITPEFIPEIYVIDQTNNAYLCEDCGALKILNFEMLKGKYFPQFGENIGTFIAKSNFYTSELYLDSLTHRELEIKCLNPSMRSLFEIELFLKEEASVEGMDPEKDLHADPERIIMGMAPWQSDAFRDTMMILRDLYMHRTDCLTHGDLHLSNIMIDAHHMKIIDQEYACVGCFSSDMGYLLGSLLFQYVHWIFNSKYDAAFRQDFCGKILTTFREILNTYLSVFTECFKKDAKLYYQKRDGYLRRILKDFIKQSCGFAGCHMIYRIGDCLPFPVVDMLDNAALRNNACRLMITIGTSLVMHWEEVDTPENITDLIEAITYRYLKIMNT